MSRSPNAQLAVEQFKILVARNAWGRDDAWKGIAQLLLSCDVWADGYRRLNTLAGKACLPDVIVYRERNDFKTSTKGFNSVVMRAEQLSRYVSEQLGVPADEICEYVGLYFRDPSISSMQPHNLVGHAFRSICTTYLEMFGDPSIAYEEEVEPAREFPGHDFSTRSKDAKIDIVARKGHRTVALISTRWRFRHDRVDVVDEALAYSHAARRLNNNCGFYALIGEFAPNRLEKILSNCPPRRNPAVDACVHFCPELLFKGLGENGRLTELKSLAWLAASSFAWH